MSDKERTRVVIIGGGFAGINAAKGLGSRSGVEVVLIDRRNHHLFQPLLYQVAMAGLSPANIAAPIRGLLSEHENITVLKGEVNHIDLEAKTVSGDFGEQSYDYLIIATGAKQSYFGHEEWAEYAPGLKTLAQATEIRRRVLDAFERAETTQDPALKKALLTFVVVGGGPTGVELAGAIGEMSRSTLARDFRHIDPKRTRVILVEAGPRILPTFPTELGERAVRDLESLGVQVWTTCPVTHVMPGSIALGDESLNTATVLWAAGVRASRLTKMLGAELDRQGRVMVQDDLSLPGHPEVLVAGDAAHCRDAEGAPLPGVAPVAMQQGRYLARMIQAEQRGKEREPFHYVDKGQMATIGRSRAIVESGPIRLTGFTAWLAWLVVHIYYLSTFRNRLLVLLQWAFSYVSFARGARLIVDKEEHGQRPAALRSGSGPSPRNMGLPAPAPSARGALPKPPESQPSDPSGPALPLPQVPGPASRAGGG